jgi:hypothetical protein
MLSRYFDENLQHRAVMRRQNRQGPPPPPPITIIPPVVPFQRRDLRTLRNEDVITDALGNNIPVETSTILSRFFNASNLIRGDIANCYNGLSRDSCLNFLLYYMIKHGDHRLRADGFRKYWDLNKNAIEEILNRFGDAIDSFNEANLTKRSNADLLAVSNRFSAPLFQTSHAMLDGTHIPISGLARDVTSQFPDSFRSKKLGYKNAVSFQVVVHRICVWNGATMGMLVGFTT